MSPAVRGFFESTRLSSPCGTVKFNHNDARMQMSHRGEPDPIGVVEAYLALDTDARAELCRALAADPQMFSGLRGQRTARGRKLEEPAS